MRFFKRLSYCLVLGMGLGLESQAQEEWDLRRCVEYAIANNISTKQADVQRRISDLLFKQGKKAWIPTADFNTNTGYQFGRSIDPTTNLFTNQQLLFQGFQFNTNVTIFNWNRITNTMLASKYEAEAALADVESNKNDLALNVATAYLTALLSKVQVDIVEVQVKQSQSQLNDTRKRVEAGTVPELNAVDLEAQLARDSSSLITAQSTYELNLLSLKALLALDAGAPFAISVPPVDRIPVDPIAELEPEMVYQMALQNQPVIKANDLRKKSLEYNIKSAKAGLYPSFFAFGGLASNFASSNRKITGANFLGYNAPNPANGAVNVNGTLVPIQSPNVQITQGNKNFGELWTGWGTQMSNNFRQNIGVGISIPILGGWQSRTNYERAKLNLANAELVIDQGNLQLKNNIYNAYTSAVAAMQKYNAARSSVSAAERSYNFTLRRYELGLLSTLELITSQTNLTRSKIDMVNAQFDYVFRMKVLEFYKGQGIKL
ncbi:TolC family protein [Flavihumibacter cheonanensis]|uniref:TolC family protein n=1 Tax=Flavihumibacter cheonanensis TaxID=1442385 RepID=UPI001EF9282D|nr:TolC family protein [Flavihumibacter cheonanensis]MCG7753792.1 TolC family protein [Flavihumibacter cheonanensis]